MLMLLNGASNMSAETSQASILLQGKTLILGKYICTSFLDVPVFPNNFLACKSV